jgi:hypothetical protein
VAGGVNGRDLALEKARAVSTRLLLGSPTANVWPADVQTFAFDLDDDLAKLVTIRPLPSGLVIEVQYGRDYVLRHDRYMFPLAGPPSIRRTAFGVSVVTTRPLLGRLQLQQSYRF